MKRLQVRFVRDVEHVRCKDSIRNFMRRLGQGKAIIVVISDSYLKSGSCMFELLQIATAQPFRERVFPIVLSDADIYRPQGRANYIQHWENLVRELDQALKPLQGHSLIKLQEDLNDYAEIRRMFDGLADTLRDMNALTPKQHKDSGFADLVQRISSQLEAAAT